MKSRYDFGDDDQYYEYLVHYYVGQLLSNSGAVKCDSGKVIEICKAIVERIKKGV